MTATRDLTGQRFGKLIALRPTEERKDRKIVWECQCDCGNIVFVRSANLTSGHTQSCGCLYKDNLTGQRFGKLVALRPTEERKNGNVVWECQCDCGNITYVQSVKLSSGRTKSCGCLWKSELSGQRFGRLIALRPTEERKNGSVVWECQCDCGNTALVPRSNLVKGRIESCGCGQNRAAGRKQMDLTAEVFGEFTPLWAAEDQKEGCAIQEFDCDSSSTTTFVPKSNRAKGKMKPEGCEQNYSVGRKYRDLTGQRFGKLVVLQSTEERKNGSVVWECQCDCGNIACVRSISLTRGHTKSCGCLRKDAAGRKNKDLTGQRFGKLNALWPTEERKGGFVMWECRCDCGNTAYVRVDCLLNGHTRSCGCLRIGATGRKNKDLTGRRFGKLVVLRPTEERKNGNVVWECRCDCGNVTCVGSVSLTSGFKRSCGCWKR